MSGIFISYRREDSAAYAGRLYDWISQHFGEENIFIDVDTIQPGEDFVEAVEQRVGACDALIALIGKDWLNCRDEEGNRRLDNQGDFVRIEVVAALNRNVRLIPILVEGAKMPAERDLPEPLTKLARKQALELSFTRFHQDANRLIETLERTLAAAEERRRTEQERRAPQHEDRPKPAAVPEALPEQTSQSPLRRRRSIAAIAGVAAAVVIGGIALQQLSKPKPAPHPTGSASKPPVKPPPAETQPTPQAAPQPTPPATTQPTPIPTPEPTPQPPVIEGFAADRSVLEAGGSATLRWSVRGGTVTLEPGIGPVTETGTRVVAPRSSTTYDLVASGPGGEARRSVTITVHAVPASTPSVSPPTITEFAAHPNPVVRDAQTTLRWSVRGGTSVTLGPGIGKVGATGTRVIRPQASITYELVANGPGGVTRRSLPVTVESPPPPAPSLPTIEQFTAQPNPVVRDQQATLRWTARGSTSVTLAPGIGTVPETGTWAVTPRSSTTYELTARGPGGVTTAKVELRVTAPAASPLTIEFSALSPIQRGESSVLRWNVSNAESVAIDQGIGRVDRTGSRKVSPNETTVYKLTASGGGQEKEATARIVVNAKPRPSETSGTLVWKGDLQPFNVLIIDSALVTKGTLRGALPGLPVTISAAPEMKVMEAPSQQNGWRRLVLQNNAQKRGEVKIAWQLILP